MKIILTFLILFSLLNANKISNISALEMQKHGALIVDIRTKFEYNTLHVKDSVNIPAHYIRNGKRIPRKKFSSELFNLQKKKEK
jgi:rhodanese-related sulfurtransferase